jgi:thymidylate kinase
MIINLIGSPASGKTTTAAMVFARIKEQNIPAEFIVEQARVFIAQKRNALGLKPEDKLILTDDDQLAIIKSQIALERTMIQACGPSVVVISDSSALNSLLYMSQELLNTSQVNELIKGITDNYALAGKSLVFWTSLLKVPSGLDPNRVHDQDMIDKIHYKIPRILAAKIPNLTPILSIGNPAMRCQRMVVEILKALLKD